MPKADDEGEVAVMPTFLRKFFFILFLVFVFGGKSCKERDALWKQSKNHEPNLIVWTSLHLSIVTAAMQPSLY